MSTFFETNLQVLGGALVFTGTRISVGLVRRKLFEGATVAELLDAYPNLTQAGIEAAARIPIEIEVRA